MWAYKVKIMLLQKKSHIILLFQTTWDLKKEYETTVVLITEIYKINNDYRRKLSESLQFTSLE